MNGRLKAVLGAVLLSGLTSASAQSQELGVFASGGVGGLRDVRRPVGAGVSGAWFFTDQIGLRVDAARSWAREHRTTLACRPGSGEPVICESVELLSKSSYPLVDAALVVRQRVPATGVQFELGAGPTNVAITNEIVTTRDSVYSPRVRSSANGYFLLAGMLIQPKWKLPISFHGMYAYHKTSELDGCVGRLNEPLCSQRFHLHELRLSAVAALRR